MSDIDNIYPLTPAQGGMLFHSLYEPGSGVYVDQFRWRIDQALDVDAFKNAWRELIRRHEVLRAGFFWEGQAEALQVIHRAVELPLIVEDWRDRSEAQVDEDLAGYLSRGLTRGFELEAAPLIRLALFRVADDRYDFIWEFHHILLDGWSVALLLDELHSVYQRLADGSEPEAVVPTAYRDYIGWLHAQDLRGPEEFWRRSLDGAHPTHLAPASKPDAKADYATEEFQLDAATTASLRQRARSLRVTPNVLVQAAWSLVLSQRVGRDDVVYGMTVSGRSAPVPQLPQAVGMFINTVPVRVRVPRSERLSNWVQQLHSQQVEIREHESTPLTKIHKWTGSGGDLFDTVMVFENYPDRGDAARPLSMELIRGVESTHYPLAMAIKPGETTHGFASFDRRHFDSATIRGLLDSLCARIADILRPGDPMVGELYRIGDRDAAAIEEWNRTVRPFERDIHFHEIWERHVRETPDAVAVQTEDGVITYAELAVRVAEVGEVLRYKGVGPGVLVGVFLERSLDLIVSVLAVMQSGGAYVPIDAEYPKQRIDYMLGDTGLRTILTHSHLRDRVRGPGRTVVCLDQRLPEVPDAPPFVRPSELDPAYVIYTSGSTGRPKGVVVPHGSFTNFLAACLDRVPVTGDDVVLQQTSICFDMSVIEIGFAFFAGARLLVPRADEPLVGERVSELLRDYDVTVYVTTPSALALVTVGEYPALRVVICGGEALTQSLAAKWSGKITNVYGPAEATVITSIADVSPTRVPDIGTPIGNVSVRILDSVGEQVPVGVAGELCVGGMAVARGYLGRPGLTADRFRPDPHASEPGGRLYHTGDLSRWKRDGRIEYLGRVDHQIKIRGHRVELGEIERVLVGHWAVSEAAVVLKQRGTDEARLVAYLVASGEPLNVSTLREWLGAELPAYMLPSTYVWLDDMPLSSSGKVDRKALPEPRSERPDLGHDLVEASNDVEERLVDIWRRVLGVDAVGVQDDFFELGGDSITSIQVVGQARVVGLPLSPRDVFEARTISGISVRLAERDEVPVEATGPVYELRGLSSPMQQWFFDQHLPRPDHFNQAVVLQAADDVDPDLVAHALDAVVARHDSLRLAFDSCQSDLHQRVLDEGRWPVTRYAPDQYGDRDATLSAAADLAHRSLDIKSGRMTSAAWVDGDARHSPCLLLVCHHLAVDAVSWRTLLEDLEQAYAQLRAGGQVNLPPVGCSYLGYVKWLNEFAQSDQLTEEAAFWMQQRDTGDIPVDGVGRGNGCHGNGELGSVAGETAVLDASLSPDETSRLLREAPTAYHASPHELMVAALARTLGDWRGDDAAYLSLEGHGRSGPVEALELSRTVGWFTALYPVRIELGDDVDWGATVRATKDHLRAVPGDGVGYGLLRYLRADDCAARLAAARPPRVCFNYVGQLDSSGAVDRVFRMAEGGDAGAAHDRDASRPHLIDVVTYVLDGALHVEWTYSTRHFGPETIRRELDGYVARLRACLAELPADDARGASDFPLAGLSAVEFAELENQLSAQGVGGR